MKIVFRPKLIPTVATIVIAPILAGLGLWQSDRAQQKLNILQLYESRLESPPITVGASLESAPLIEYRQVKASGQWDPDHEFYLDNRVLNGRAGFDVITPLKFKGARTAVLVNRGWIPASADRSISPHTKRLEGETLISGTAVIPPEDAFMLKPEPPLSDGWQTVWQTLDLARFESGVDYRIQGFVIRLHENHADGFERAWAPPQNEWIYRHKAYAFQWYALCAALLVIYFLFAFRPQKHPDLKA